MGWGGGLRGGVGGLGVQPKGHPSRTSVKVAEIRLLFLLLAQHFPAAKHGELYDAHKVAVCQSCVLETDADACKRDEASCNTRVKEQRRGEGQEHDLSEKDTQVIQHASSSSCRIFCCRYSLAAKHVT